MRSKRAGTPKAGTPPNDAELSRMGGSAMLGLLFDAVTSVESFLRVFVYVYSLVILAYIITSWVRMPYSVWLNRIQRFLYDVCDPYLRMWRRVLPNFGPLDLSPVVGVAALYVLLAVAINILDRLH
jgi:YggT family protein